MSGKRLSAASTVDRREPSNRRWTGLMARRMALAALPALVLLLGAASSAHATSSFYWYGENDSTCWQTGHPSSSSQKCSEVGPSYLLSHLTGSYKSASGDYCTYYNIGEGLDTTNENNQFAFSGFTPPNPLGSYQEGNHYGSPGPDVCQASGSKWGQVVRGNSANNHCGAGYAPCGMQHVVSFGTQQLEDRPWGQEMGSPALVISAEANPHKVEAPNSWGYVCPLLKETGGGGHILEFCLEQWHVGWGQFPLLHEFDEATECNNGLGQVITAFKPGTKFAELVPGSAETFEFKNNPAPRTFTARITPGELVLAIEALEKRCGPTEKSSHNASEYALVGVTQGVEGGGNVNLIGNATAKLQLRTEYTPLEPASEPFALREPNTGNEDLFYRGSNGALWQRAWTPSGGWKEPLQIGGALTSKPMGFIAPNGTMNIFYRGANDAIWQAYREANGHWSTYEVTPGAPLSSGKPYAYMEPNGTMNVFYCSTSNVISQLYFTGSSWTDPGMAVGEAAPCGGDPSAYMKASGEQNVFYRTTSGNVGQVWWNSAGWHNSPIEVGGDVTGTVSAYLESSGVQHVVYRTTSNTMGQVWWNSEGWHNSPLGGQVFSNPDGFVTPNGIQHVYYVNNYGTIGEWYWESASGWHNHELGEAAEGDPSGFAAPGGEVSVFFVQAGAGLLDQWYYNAKGEWGITTVGPGSPPLPAPTNTAVPRISGTPQQGQVLTASNGTWTNEPTSYGYQWERCNSSGAECANIGGATSSTYTATEADIGHTMVVKVTATNTSGSGSASSVASSVVKGLVVGDATTTYSVADQTTAGREEAFQFTAKATGKGEELQFRTNATANTGITGVVLGIFAESSGKPGEVLGQATVSGEPATNSWIKATGLSISVTSGTKYWLVLLPLGSGSKQLHFNAAASSGGTGNVRSVTGGLSKLTAEGSWETYNQGPVGFQAIGP
jgi:hypothetical protein